MIHFLKTSFIKLEKRLYIILNESLNIIKIAINNVKTFFFGPSFLSESIKNQRFISWFPIIQNDNIDVLIAEDVVNDFINVYRVCSKFSINKENIIVFNKPLAIIKLQLYETPNSKTRNIIKKAVAQGYTYLPFDFNDFLDDIYEINISKEFRSAGGKMRGWYLEKVQPRQHVSVDHYLYFGCFKEKKLFAYCHLVICGNLGFFRHFIGHADHLSYGIMNGLIHFMIKYIKQYHPLVEYFSYGILNPFEKGKLNSHEFFKKQASFESTLVFCHYDLPNLFFKGNIIVKNRLRNSYSSFLLKNRTLF